MNWPGNLRTPLAATLGALLTLAVGLMLLVPHSSLHALFEHSSYDWLFQASRSRMPQVEDSGVIIIYLDEISHQTLGQHFNKPWDRGLHAQLLDLLTAEGARAVIFDIIFSDPGPEAKADDDLAAAIRRNGRVILAAEFSSTTSEGAQAQSIVAPWEPFREGAAGWGFAMMAPDTDFMVRRHFHGPFPQPSLGPITSLAWAAAKFLKMEVARTPDAELAERWVNYYGPPETIPNVSYAQALLPDGVKPGIFRNQIVFIGSRPITGLDIDRRDEMRNPFTATAPAANSLRHPEYNFMPAVEVHATELLNLARQDWLRRTPWSLDLCLVLATALIFGSGLLRFKPLPAALIAALGSGAILLGALAGFRYFQVFFPWLVMAGAQVPFAWFWCVMCKSVDWYIQRQKLERERRAADAQIREQAALLDKAQDAIIVHDLEWRTSFWNRSAERVYGWTAAEVRAEALVNLIARGDAARLDHARKTVLENGEWSGELRHLTKTGKEIIVQSRWSLVRDPGSKPASILVINTDVTEQKQLELQFLRAQRMESIGTLAGGIAHDLNNVLSPIMMGIDLLKMSATQDAFSQKMLNSMGASARRGAAMVKQVLTFARGHEGDRIPLDLSGVVREMQKIALETFPKNIEIHALLDEPLWLVLGDATQCHQVLLNLSVNARDAMPQGGKITLGAANVCLGESTAKQLLGARAGKYVCLSVTDNGSGMPPAVKDKIFEPFFTTKEVGKGTGLGLATVSSIIKNHEGVLDLQTEVGRGTSFKIYLPAIASTEQTASAETPLEQMRGRGQRVLIVDDEPAIREVFEDTLTRHGYQIFLAANGAEALTRALQEPRLDLALVDMMMPVMDGSETIRSLQRTCPRLRLLAMSGLQLKESDKEFFAASKIICLTKPIPARELLKIVHQTLADQSGE